LMVSWLVVLPLVILGFWRNQALLQNRRTLSKTYRYW
jgi:hypothetical protein